jgi:hypothetical protein
MGQTYAKRRNKISGLRPAQMDRWDAERAISIVVEGQCPLCAVQLIRHGDKACCPCGGCSLRVEGHSLLMTSCADHPAKNCEHWQAVWRARDASTDVPV